MEAPQGSLDMESLYGLVTYFYFIMFHIIFMKPTDRLNVTTVNLLCFGHDTVVIKICRSTIYNISQLFTPPS